MKKPYQEIGSEFWDVPQTQNDNGIFSESTQWFLSGRSALQAIIAELRGCHTVAMPSWCCDSMVKPFISAGMEVHFYPVYFNEGLKQDVSFECDVLFLMDYFGYTAKQLDLSSYNGVVIRDVTHSLFSITHTDADYYFGSLRKWCGVRTGGFAWSGDGHQLRADHQGHDYGYTALREKAMHLKCKYINGIGVVDKSYLRIFSEAEEILETISVLSADVRDIQSALKLDIEYIKVRRRKNAEIIRKAYPDWLIFNEMKDTDCPMFVPVLVPDGKRVELSRHLIANDIYCPIHWPLSEYHTLDQKTESIYANELSFVCDQRYSEDDMYRMVEIIQMFWKEK